MAADAQAHIRIGTRGSPLALAQAEAVAAALGQSSGGAVTTEIVTFTTRGDQLTSERLTEAGGKGLFTREIDRAVDAGEVDIAVHSLKDVPSHLPEGQEFVAFPPREDPRDALICHTAAHPRDLPEGAVVGTASLRREAQTRFLRPDLQIVTFRGNVQTRLRKLEEGQADATYLAMAGLNRLGLSRLASPLPLSDFLCAPCQGIVGVVAREGALPDAARAALSQLNHEATARCALAERAFLARIDGSCRTAMGAILQTGQGRTRLWAEWIADDGSRRVRRSADIPDKADTAALMDAGHRIADLVRAGMTG